MNRCPECGSYATDTYRHPKAKVWCMSCGFVLRDEGSSEWNKPVKSNYEHIRVKDPIEKLEKQNVLLRRKLKRYRKHIKQLEKGVKWRNNLIYEKDEEYRALQKRATLIERYTLDLVEILVENEILSKRGEVNE